VGPDAATRGRVAHHQVVEPRIGNEVEAAQQRVGARIDQVGALHQQRPVALGERLQVGAAERSARKVPAAPLTKHQPRLDVVAGGET